MSKGVWLGGLAIGGTVVNGLSGTFGLIMAGIFGLILAGLYAFWPVHLALAEAHLGSGHSYWLQVILFYVAWVVIIGLLIVADKSIQRSILAVALTFFAVTAAVEIQASHTLKNDEAAYKATHGPGGVIIYVPTCQTLPGQPVADNPTCTIDPARPQDAWDPDLAADCPKTVYEFDLSGVVVYGQPGGRWRQLSGSENDVEVKLRCIAAANGTVGQKGNDLPAYDPYDPPQCSDLVTKLVRSEVETCLDSDVTGVRSWVKAASCRSGKPYFYVSYQLIDGSGREFIFGVDRGTWRSSFHRQDLLNFARQC